MIQLRLDPRASAPAFRYRVAGGQLVADRELGWLAAFALEGEGALLPGLEPAASAEPGETLFADSAFLARRERFFSCRRLADAFQLEVEGLGEFRYVESAGRVEVLAAAAGAPEELLVEVLLGPLLALALAQRGIFLLHASGCELDGATWLMLGESGAGKSTLAANLGGLRLADDQAAVDAITFGLLADFPQPKLDQSLQVPMAAAERRKIAGILLLEKSKAEAEPELEPLPRLAATAGILGHTTAARCFDQELLRRHLDFAAGLAGQVPCFRLRYPHRPGAIEKIGALLTRG